MLRRAHEHPLKSIRATFVVVAAVTFNGWLFVSFVAVASGGVQFTPDEENTPTLGLLAGTTRVYCLQFAFKGLPVGQFVLASTEIDSVESTAGVAPMA